MKNYKYNAEFFGTWMSRHPEINKRDILNVLETKDYASLKRWADGNEMPTKSIVKLCNHFDIAIENFFIGMSKIVEENTQESSENIENNVFHEEEAEPSLTSGKRAQLEARHIKDTFLREKQYQQQIDHIRAEYDQRLDTQREQMMQTIDKQAEQLARQSEVIAHLSEMLAGGKPMRHDSYSSSYGVADPMHPLSSNIPQAKK